MNLAPVVDFITNNKAVVRYTMPAVGNEGPFNPVFKALTRDNKIAVAVVGLPFSDHDAAYTVVGCFVRDIIETPGSFRLVIDKPFPEQALDIQKCDADQEDEWEKTHVDYDDANDGVVTELSNALMRTPDYGQPGLGFRTKYVRWSEWVNGERRPRGVILVSPDRRLHALGFPGSEDPAAGWNRFTNVPDDGLEQLAAIAGRTNFISVPETIKAETWEDAPLRALHEFGSDYYRETGRTLFP